MKSSSDFSTELSRLPRSLAVELEDHLSEEISRLVAGGIPEQEARSRALAQLGSPAEIAAASGRALRDPIWGSARIPLQNKLLFAGWTSFSLLWLGRICTHEDPSYASVALCLFLGLFGTAIGVGLLRLCETARRFALVGSVMMAGVLLVKGAVAFVMPMPVPYGVWLLPVLAAGAVLSAWILSRPSFRNRCV